MKLPLMKGAVAPATEVDARAIREYEEWIGEGHHAGMGYMENHRDLRKDPRHLHPGTRSILSLAMPFPLFTARDRHPERGSIASYALGSDYHDVIREMLRAPMERLREKWGGEWRLCIDSAPVMERYWAVQSGLGFRTSSGMVYVEGYGTACFLAELLMPREAAEMGLPERGVVPIVMLENFLGLNLETDIEAPGRRVCDHCGGCRKVCPAGALRPDGSLDARLCLSYLTIEHRGDWTTPEAIRAMKTPEGRNTLFGCDRCLRGCHLNFPLPEEAFHEELRPRKEIEELSATEAARITQEEFSRLFRGSPIKRAKVTGLRRNALGTGVASENAPEAN